MGHSLVCDVGLLCTRCDTVPETDAIIEFTFSKKKVQLEKTQLLTCHFGHSACYPTVGVLVQRIVRHVFAGFSGGSRLTATACKSLEDHLLC